MKPQPIRSNVVVDTMIDRGKRMTYSLTCADTGANCPGSFTTENQDELMEHVMLHAQRAHPELVGNEQLGAMVKTLIKQG